MYSHSTCHCGPPPSVPSHTGCWQGESLSCWGEGPHPNMEPCFHGIYPGFLEKPKSITYLPKKLIQDPPYLRISSPSWARDTHRFRGYLQQTWSLGSLELLSKLLIEQCGPGYSWSMWFLADIIHLTVCGNWKLVFVKQKQEMTFSLC